MESSCLSRANAWLKSGKAKENILKQYKELNRDFYTPPSFENKIREDLLTSQLNISLSLIDGKLFHNGFHTDELFYKLKKTEQDSGGISMDQFSNTLNSFQIQVDAPDIRRMYDELLARDKKSKEHVKPPSLRLIRTNQVRDSLQSTYKYNGMQGSPWKKYVSPAHRIMMFHNVITDVKLLEYEMTTKRLKQIVHDNERSKCLLEIRRRFVEAKKADCEFLMETEAAMVFQRMYAKWNGKKGIQKNRWKLDFKEIRRKKGGGD